MIVEEINKFTKDKEVSSQQQEKYAKAEVVA
jgi:hypothetical protein